jgi:hypothetical protein
MEDADNNWIRLDKAAANVVAKLTVRGGEIQGSADIAAPTVKKKTAITANDDGGSFPAGRINAATGGKIGAAGQGDSQAAPCKTAGEESAVLQQFGIAKAASNSPYGRPSVDGPIICPTHHVGPSFDLHSACLADFV